MRLCAFRRLSVALAMLTLVAASCAGPGLWTDLTSVSTGRTNGGFLRKPARLPEKGPGFVIPERWAKRGFNYGVDELVAAVERAAWTVWKRDRRARVGVGDFSRDRGGSSIWHRSHHSGRDVDILFYTVDGRGRPLPPPTHDMIHFDADGRASAPRSRRETYVERDWQKRRFDVARNWQFIASLLVDPSIRVQWIFVSEPLKTKLLAHAREVGAPAWVIAYADTVVRQPEGVPPHDDHFHIRIYCSRSDRFHGCEDSGVVWQHEKKTYKYFGPERYDPVLWRVALRPMRGLY